MYRFSLSCISWTCSRSDWDTLTASQSGNALCTCRPCVQLNSSWLSPLHSLSPTLYEDPRFVHFLINIFMMDYDLNPMSWGQSPHLDRLMWERPHNSCVWKKYEIKRWPGWPHLTMCAAVFLPQWCTCWHARPRPWTATESSMVTQEGEKQGGWPWCGGQVTASPLHCLNKMFLRVKTMEYVST